uniref:Putative lipase C16A3.12c n=1 Tax=Aceria tosichella TaxID=561515 RepID=A0A6G1S378_9ACAR
MWRPQAFNLLALFSFIILHKQLAAVEAQSQADSDNNRFYAGPGVMPSQILRARGFLTEDHDIITKDNYTIRLTRALNPLINKGKRGLRKRIPIIITHGILESFNVFVVNSAGARPKNFSNSSLADLTVTGAWARHAFEPSAKSLPMLALNYGHEVWLMSRRGFPGSQRQLGNPVEGINGDMGVKTVDGPLTAFLGGISDYGRLAQQLKFSVDKRFWNFSLDEQAKYDLPEVVDYVLKRTGRKQVSFVGHSAGGALALMALSVNPELNKKLNNVILWSGAFSLGREDIFAGLTSSRPLLEGFVGAVPPTFTTDQLQAIGGLFCSSKLTQSTLCEGIGDLILGDSLGTAPLKPEFLNSLLYSSSSHELAQLLQNVEKGGRMHLYDHGREGNLLAYGREHSPRYNLSCITLERLSFYEAQTDFIVTVADIEASRRLLRVPHYRHLIPAPFNHQGYFFSNDNARLAVIPSLREIQLFSERDLLGDANLVVPE